MGAIEQRCHEQTSIYNLKNDEEELTHYDQWLSKMEYFDDIVLSSDDDIFTEGKGQYLRPFIIKLYSWCYVLRTILVDFYIKEIFRSKGEWKKVDILNIKCYIVCV